MQVVWVWMFQSWDFLVGGFHVSARLLYCMGKIFLNQSSIPQEKILVQP